MEMQHTSYSSKNPMEKEIVYNSLLNASGFSDSDDEEEVSVGTHDSTLPDFDSEKGSSNKSDVESFEFTEMQSPTWKKHKVRRFFQDGGKFWTLDKKTESWKWFLVLLSGVLIGATGVIVSIVVDFLSAWKLGTVYRLMSLDNVIGAFFAYNFYSVILAFGAAILCVWQPGAAGSGIPEIIAFLNGINFSDVITFKVLFAKVVSMCLSVSSGLPIGKEGPMIHCGAIISGLTSQGYTCSMGYDSSWKLFQDMRNDENKRDFVTYGAAAGISGAFRAPIGGILFALEEGASFWSTSVTLRAFMCAVMCQFTVSVILTDESTSSSEMFAFGEFSNMTDGRTNYHMYEIPVFFLMGLLGGCMGALFNYINKRMTLYRMKHINSSIWKRVAEALVLTLLIAFIGFVLSFSWQTCTPMPATDDDTTEQELELMDQLVQFQCPNGYYNQLASLYITTGDSATRQLFHFREFQGSGSHSFSFGALILFFVPYYVLAAITAGVLVPAGLFVPTLLAGAAYGRIIGHLMNLLLPVGYAADSGSYALIGAASMLGGMARMTIAGTVICLEACGNMAYLLPLMVTFAGARYAGNAIDNNSMYEIQIKLKKLPFLESSLHNLGLLTYQDVSQIMTSNVVTLKEVDTVKNILHVLKTTGHNGFPVVNEKNQLRGLILRRTLCSLLQFKAYSIPTGQICDDNKNKIEVIPASTVAYDTLERTYPHFLDISSIKLTDTETTYWLDMKPYMDHSPYMVNKETTIQRVFRLFRTIGLRHLLVVDGQLCVIGMVTRKNLAEEYLHDHWEHEGNQMIKSLNVDVSESTFVDLSSSESSNV